MMCIGLAQNYETFLLFRLAIGAIGASFVITQYHTSVMFAPNVVGTANATTAGWGNLGGGLTHIVMPLMLVAVITLGISETLGWRMVMVIPGIGMIFTGIAYYFLTQDCPEGNYKQLRASGKMAPSSASGSFWEAARDYRVWALFFIYGASFGVELTITNIASLYYYDRFELSIGAAGLIAGLFGLMNIFARTLGGIISDRTGIKFGLKGRVMFMGTVLLLEGVALVLFSQMTSLFLAVGAMIIFSTFVQMAEGATFAIVPFVNRRSLGSVAGIVGAGGPSGAVVAGFLFRSESMNTEQALLLIGICVLLVAPMVFLVRFSPQTEAVERSVMVRALAGRTLAGRRLAEAPGAGD